MGRAAAADGKLDACVEPSGADNEMKAKVSIVRTDPFMEFNYCKVQWEAGDVSGGSGGYWQGPDPAPARAGFARANGSYFEFSGSGVERGLLDVNQTTGLIWHSFNSTNSGRYFFEFRDGSPRQTP